MTERWYEIMRSLPGKGWVEQEFAEAACKRIAELERELEVSREARRCVEKRVADYEGADGCDPPRPARNLQKHQHLDALGLAAHSIVKRAEADDECARLRKRIAELEAERDALLDVALSVQRSHKGSMGSIGNVYCAQLDVKRVDAAVAKARGEEVGRD